MEFKEIVKNAYYYDKSGMLLHGDCLEWMEKFPDQSIDMILCDLPYGTTRNKWDSVIDLDKLWKQYERIIKNNTAIVLTAQTPFDKILGASKIELLKYEWIWRKQQGTGHLNAKKMPMKNHENILVFYKNLPVYNPQFTEGKPYVCKSGRGSTNYNEQVSVVTENKGKRYPLSVIEFQYDKEKLHPTQKPVSLFEYFINTYSNEGMIILDNTAGVCTTAIAAKNLNRKWICIEKEEKYCDVSKERILKHKNTIKN